MVCLLHGHDCAVVQVPPGRRGAGGIRGHAREARAGRVRRGRGEQAALLRGQEHWVCGQHVCCDGVVEVSSHRCLVRARWRR